MCEALVWWVFAERLPITQRLWANKSLNMTMWPAFKCLCPYLGWTPQPIYSSGFILKRSSGPPPNQFHISSAEISARNPPISKSLTNKISPAAVTNFLLRTTGRTWSGASRCRSSPPTSESVSATPASRAPWSSSAQLLTSPENDSFGTSLSSSPALNKTTLAGTAPRVALSDSQPSATSWTGKCLY